MHCEETNAGRVNACDYQVCTDVALVPEKILLEHRHTGDDPRFPSGRECMKLKIRGDQGGGEFGICSGTGTCTPYLRSDIMQLLAVLHPITLVTVSRTRTRNGKTLSATIGPLVALVSAAITTPPSKMHPTIVVPVLVALGSGTPCACKAALRL